MTRRIAGEAPLPGFGAGHKRLVARVRRGVDEQIAAQRGAGRLDTVDQGLVAIARTIADALDAEFVDPNGSRYTVGALAGKLVPVLLELRGERYDHRPGDDVDNELAWLVAALRDAPRPDA